MDQIDQLDVAVDAQYGEPIELRPYKPGAQYMTTPVVDSSRPVTQAVGYVVGKGTMLRAAGSSSFMLKRADAELFIKVRDQYLVNTRQGDHVALKDPRRGGAVYEISFIEPGTNFRQVLHLLQVAAS
jgi:hypothetical protein